MKNRFFTIITSLILCGTILGMSACIKENRDDCDLGSVKFIVEIDRGILNNHPNIYDVENMNIYIFDQNKAFYKFRREGALTEGKFETYLKLPVNQDRKFHFIVWTNASDCYKTTIPASECDETTMLTDIEAYFDCPEDGYVWDDLQDAHYGSLFDALIIKDADNTVTVTLRPITYKINFIVEGLPVGDDEFEFSIKDNNCYYDFEGSIVDKSDESDYIHYIRSTGFEGNTLMSSLKTLKLEEGREPEFKLLNSTESKILYQANLIKMIEGAYASADRTVNFKEQFEFTIKLRFDSNLGVTIIVDGWEYQPDPGELG